jgi:UDP-glucose 4-epimerase
VCQFISKCENLIQSVNVINFWIRIIVRCLHADFSDRRCWIYRISYFGGDYPTADGTCIRDYLHVTDLAEGHVAAVDWLAIHPDFRGVEAFNLGTGHGVSVLEIIQSFETATQQKIDYQIVDRREGDLPAFWANVKKSHQVLGWQAKRSLSEMMEDAWRWQSQNPNGYS